MSSLALRTLGRYLLPIAIVSALACAPFAHLAFRAPWPRDLVTANVALGRAFALAGFAWAVTFVLVGAVAPLARALAVGRPLSQVHALRAAVVNGARMLIPSLTAIAAVVIGGLALVVPALVLMVAFALTGASEARGMPAPLVDSAEAVRVAWRPVAAVIGAMILVDVVLAIGAWKLVAVPFGRKLAPAQWATYGNVARVVVLGVLVTSPIFAVLLACIRVRR